MTQKKCTKSFIVLLAAPPKISQIKYEKKSEKGMLIEASAGSHLNVKSQSTVKLYCNATGVPAPQITWERQGYDSRRGMVVSQVSTFIDDLFCCKGQSSFDIFCIFVFFVPQVCCYSFRLFLLLGIRVTYN